MFHSSAPNSRSTSPMPAALPRGTSEVLRVTLSVPPTYHHFPRVFFFLQDRTLDAAELERRTNEVPYRAYICCTALAGVVEW